MTQDDSGENSHEIELVVHLFEDRFGEALFAAPELLLFEPGGAIGLSVNERLASKAAGCDAGKGVEHAQQVEWIRLDG